MKFFKISKLFILFSIALFFTLTIWLSKISQKKHKQQELSDSSIPFSSTPSSQFVLFTIPKTGTHLVRPLLEYLTNKRSISYWSKEVCCPKSYLYDKNMTDLLLLLPQVVQIYWLHQPVHKN